MRLTPLQKVKKNFENRAKLIDELAKMLDKQHGDASDADVKKRLKSLTNLRLLRLYDVEQRVRERFGSRDALVDAIVKARQEAGLTADDAFRTKLASYGKARLLDMTRQKHAPRPEKLSSEARIKARRGKAKKAAQAAAAR